MVFPVTIMALPSSSETARSRQSHWMTDDSLRSSAAAARTTARTAGPSWGLEPRRPRPRRSAASPRHRRAANSLRNVHRRSSRANPALRTRASGPIRASRRSSPPASAHSSCARHRPIPSKFSSAKPSGSISAWQLAQAGFAAVLLHPLAHRLRRRSPPFSLSAGTLGGGGGGGAPSMFSSSHLPRSDRRRPVRRTTSRSGCSPGRAAAARPSVERHAAELTAVHVRNAVVPRQPLVDERVVGRQQLEHAAVVAQDWLSRNSSVSRRNRLPQVVVEIREQHRVRRRRAAGCAAAATAPAKFVDERPRRAGRPACGGPAARAPPAPAAVLRAACSSSSSGMLLQRKNDRRDASSTSLIR